MATADPPYLQRRPTQPIARTAPATAVDPEIARVRKFARILDGYFIDPVLGFVLPGAGDVIGAMLGLYTVAIAIRRRISPVVIARMLMNLALDAILGAVPLLGDAVDVAWKANQRNVALLEDRHATGGRATARDWLMVAGAALLFAAAVGLAIYVVGAILNALANAM